MIPTSVQPNPRSAAPLVVERTYPARPEALWALWTTVDGFQSWWGPQGFRADVHKLEAREGGALHYDMCADTDEMRAAMRASGSGESHAVRTEFATFEPYTRLALRSIIDFLPGVPPYESRIDVVFEDLGAATRMVVTLHPMHDDDTSRMQLAGFTSQLTKLDARYAAS